MASHRSHYGTELKVPNVSAVVKVHVSHRSRKTVKTPFLLVLGLLVGVASGASWAAVPAPALAGRHAAVVHCTQACGRIAPVSAAGWSDSMSSTVMQADLAGQVREADQSVWNQRIQRVVALLSRYSNFAIAW